MSETVTRRALIDPWHEDDTGRMIGVECPAVKTDINCGQCIDCRWFRYYGGAGGAFPINPSNGQVAPYVQCAFTPPPPPKPTCREVCELLQDWLDEDGSSMDFIHKGIAVKCKEALEADK